MQCMFSDRESCLHAKYFINYEDEQMLRIQVVKDTSLLNNRLFHGKGWSTARVPLNASSNLKVHAYNKCGTNNLE